jgi:hypothetical protein
MKPILFILFLVIFSSIINARNWTSYRTSRVPANVCYNRVDGIIVNHGGLVWAGTSEGVSKLVDFSLEVSTTTITFPASENGTSSFDIVSNISWTVSSNQDWLTIDKPTGSNNSSVFVTASPNFAANQRTATLTISGAGVSSRTITVIQDASPPTLDVSVNSLNADATAESFVTFTITSNTEWNIITDQPWVTLSKTTGSNDADITITVAANATIVPKTSIITISGNGVSSKAITLTQAGAHPSLEVSTNVVDIPSTDNPNLTFDIISNTDWNITSDQLWLSISNPTGSNNATITESVLPNTSVIARSATLTISGNGVLSKTIFVTQAAAPPVLTVSSNTLDVPAAADSNAGFDISSNSSWSISCDQPWITLSNTIGSNEASITVSALVNPAITPRTAILTVTGNDMLIQIITITQAAALPTLEVSKDLLEVTSASDTVTFDITSNTDWEIKSDKDWLMINNAIGSNNTTIAVMVSPNTSSSPREATITILISGEPTKTILVKQSAGSVSAVFDITNPSITLYPVPIKDKLTISSLKSIFPGNIAIYSQTGTKVYSNTIPGDLSEVDMGKFISGVYFVKITSIDNKVFTEKIIKQ